MKIVILAGGSGTRLWPVSRKNDPKQIKPLLGKKTLLQLTYSRIKKGFKETDIIISINHNQLKEVRRQLPKVKKCQIICEPVKKDTAAAIGLTTAMIARKNPKEIIATVNSDHFIKDEKEFLRVIKLAGKTVKQYPSQLLLVGLNPTYPETGYGYIKLNKQIKSFGNDKIFTVDCFIEWHSLIRKKINCYYQAENKQKQRHSRPRSPNCCQLRWPPSIRRLPPRSSGSLGSERAGSTR